MRTLKQKFKLMARITHRLLDKLNTPVGAKTSHHFHVSTAIVATVSMIALAWHLKIAPFDPPALIPGDIDLSGKWSINYKDDPSFSDPRKRSEDWCEIGVPDPKNGNPKIKPGCPTEIYPATAMQNSAYWYQKWVYISANDRWREPSLFLGAIKHRAWIYWDGKLIAISNFKEGSGMTTVILDQKHVTEGRHLLAIRVETEQSKYPGIFHAYSRKVALGELENTKTQHDKIIREKYIYPALNLFTQIVGIFITIVLLYLARGNHVDFFWLFLYFSLTSAISGLNAFGNQTSDRYFFWFLTSISGISIFGYSLKAYPAFTKFRHALSRVVGLSILTFSGLAIWGHSAGHSIESMSRIFIAMAIFPILAHAAGVIASFFVGKKSDHYKINFSEKISVYILLSNHLISAVPVLAFAGKPIIADSPAIKSILSISLVISMIHQYTTQERALAFFGRFIRPGLKALLEGNSKSFELNSGKLFRPRKVSIMKIDIVNHTQTTFGMPFGIKRLFQDTWFTCIDQVVSERIFLDKNVGDGSVYCFNENHADGSCRSAFIAASEILNFSIHSFDQLFNSRLIELIKVTPELEAPSEKFFAAYKARTGHEFSYRRTQVRIGLVYGFVDEGLWGNANQSHYDVQGDLVSLAARVESKANPNEIIMSKDFFKKVTEEGQTAEIDKAQLRSEHLKGIGATELYVVSRKTDDLLKAG